MGTIEKLVSDGEMSDKPQRKGRKDQERLHVTHHGVLSKSPLQVLANRGENVRQLRRIERMLRSELRPVGILGEILFDRLFSSYLRCVLISRIEEDFLFPNCESRGTTPMLRESELPTLVFVDPDLSTNQLSDALMRHLAIVRKYDSHYSREFYRALDLLLTLPGGGEGVARQTGKTFLHKGGSRDANHE